MQLPIAPSSRAGLRVEDRRDDRHVGVDVADQQRRPQRPRVVAGDDQRRSAPRVERVGSSSCVGSARRTTSASAARAPRGLVGEVAVAEEQDPPRRHGGHPTARGQAAAMLAYLFWHEHGRTWTTTATSRCSGFPRRARVARRRRSCGLERAPRLAPGYSGPARAPFEDWYLVADWPALGMLERRGGARCATPRMTRSRRWRRTAPAGCTCEPGARRAGTVDGLGVKPPASATRRRAAARAAVDAAGGGAVFRRQMVLGPAPEYALLAAPEPALPWPVPAPARPRRCRPGRRPQRRPSTRSRSAVPPAPSRAPRRAPRGPPAARAPGDHPVRTDERRAPARQPVGGGEPSARRPRATQDPAAPLVDPVARWRGAANPAPKR